MSSVQRPLIDFHLVELRLSLTQIVPRLLANLLPRSQHELIALG